MILFPRRISIPESFYSEETDAPFETCLVCERPLLEPETEYLIEKAYRRYPEFEVQETIFEYALCIDCHEDVVDSFSESSQEQCEAYFSDSVDLERRAMRLLQKNEDDADESRSDAEATDEEAPRIISPSHHDGDEAPPDLDAWLDGCVAHGTPKDELQEYQVLGHCVGESMVLTHMPLMLGGPAMDELMQLLSNETLDELGGFRDEYFGLPPEFDTRLQGPVFV